MDGAATSEGEHKASGGDEVAIEDLEKREKANGKDYANQPDGVSAVLEGNGGGKAAAEETLPGSDVGDGSNSKNIETGADEQSHGNCFEEILRGETGVGLFSGFGNGFKAGDEIGDDLQGEKDGRERGVAEERLEICS